ncbi:MAG: (E)-4-hydroxy-3-methylbut-2-enyl-diphosphate synthase [Paramuribaculum sp.]|nr:(E)-4-hydroxy-3-methylbut-2-enyl-diphosphate synthase [Paramuribaculum sp.]
MHPFDYKRRSTRQVIVGGVPLGGDNPIRIQTMASTSTMDTEGSVAQTLRMVAAGAEYVRFTAQGVREAVNLGEIRRRLRAQGVDVPLVADIHFNPRAAFAAAEEVEKVRINPGNFVDPGRVFATIDYTDEEYAAELKKIEEALVPFLELCRKNNTAIRIGVNHGSLSDRIMSRYGDTPAGMVESAMEFLRVCRRHDFGDVVISIKASNVVVMVETVRRLVAAMKAEDLDFPLHLGVTEAGEGEDGRIKSAVGIGTLLCEGIGDTVRVSLSEEPECELPVARALVDYAQSLAGAPSIDAPEASGEGYDSRRIRNVGGSALKVVMSDTDDVFDDNFTPDIIAGNTDLKLHRCTADEVLDGRVKFGDDEVIVLSSHHRNYIGHMKAAFHALKLRNVDNPVIIKAGYEGLGADEVKLRGAVECGALLLDGYGDGLMIEADSLSAADAARLAFAILQSARLRFSHTEYISCPGCGRTLFDLQSTVARVKAATSHLRGLKIGVMGCIVNGPGEMADADYGYVGAGVGRVSLYKGKECVEKNIPAEEAVEHLVNLIKKCGDWK